MSTVVDVTAATFRQEVVEAEGLVLVDFWAQWCGPCKQLSPVLDTIAADHEGSVKIAKVDVDTERQLGAMFQIMSIPTVMVYKNGIKVDEFQGFRPHKDIEALIARHS